MIGAIIGDIVGSRFEFDNINTKNFEFWGEGCEFTDDTVMTIAVAEALLYTRNPDELGNVLKDIMKDYGHGYPDVGYGGMFRQWLVSEDPQPYNSFGNGSAMRVSSCGYVAESLEEALVLAKASAEISHNHPEGIKGAQAIATAIYMARNGIRKDGIKQYIEDNFYKLDFRLNDVKENFHISESCQDTVPQSIQCFLLADSFEDTIRNAVSIGGDSDTIACIAGSIAEAYYGIPDEFIEKAKTYLPKCFINVIDKFYSFVEDNSSLEKAKKKMMEYITRHNEKHPRNVLRSNCICDYVDIEKVHIGILDLDEIGYGCIKCECGWFVYECFFERGADDSCFIGPYEGSSVLKPLCILLNIDRETSGLEKLTDDEENTFYYGQWHVDDFPDEFCKNCKHNSWCLKRRR